VCRYLYRVPLLLVHLLLFLPLLLVGMLPPWGNLRVGGRTLEHLLVNAWSGGLMWIFGFRLHRIGTPLPGAVLFVANHVSWVDISMLHSQRMMGFVAKREIAGWPVVGWLAARGQTIFHQRGSTESLGGVMQLMVERLQQGKAVGVFPEGRSTPASSRPQWKPRCRYSRWRCATACAATRRPWSRSASAKASSPTSCACWGNRHGGPRCISSRPLAPMTWKAAAASRKPRVRASWRP
jgi:1-acyl-sn-glycerol-3-phosphate acyltransferase